MAARCLRSCNPRITKCKLFYCTSKLENAIFSVRYSSTFSNSRNEVSEYSDVPEYPKIFESTRRALKKRDVLKETTRIQYLPTVAQKLLEVARKRIHRAILISPFPKSYLATLPFYQSITKTTLIRNLPECYQNDTAEEIYSELENHFLEYVRLYNIQCGGKNARSFIQDVVFLLMRSLASKRDHLIRCTHDISPRCDAFWWKGSFNTDNLYCNRYKDEMNVGFQFLDKPYLQIRTDKPLSQFVSLEDPLCNESEVPKVNIHPRFLNLSYECRYPTSTPGFWPGDPYEFPYMSIHKYNPKFWLTKLRNPEELDDMIMCHGIMSSFTWLLGIATNLGFTQFSGITYPLVTQTVVTDGQTWTFFAYQMNTISLHGYVDDNSLRNVCWTSGQMKLYESFEDGKVIGFNPDVFKTLIKYFLSIPTLPEGVDLKPYVGRVPDRRNFEQREKDIYNLIKVYSNRTTTKDKQNETPKWKWIYKHHPYAKPCPWQNN